MVSAQRRKQLSDARAARQPRVKRQKLDTTPSENNEKENSSAAHSAAHSTAHSAAQSDLDQSEEDSYNGVWYWDRSSDEDISHSGKGKGNNRAHVVEPNNATEHQISVTTQQDSAIQQTPPSLLSMLGWEKDGDKHLRGTWGAGSQSTKERQARNGRQFEEQASQSYSLTAMIEREKPMAVEQAGDEVGLASNIPIQVARDTPVSQREAFKIFEKTH